MKVFCLLPNAILASICEAALNAALTRALIPYIGELVIAMCLIEAIAR